MAKVKVIMGSTSDYEIMKGAKEIFEYMGVEYDMQVLSAHRTPMEMIELAKNLKKDGYSVVVGGAGGAAHLPGMVAALTTIPVIGIPIKTATLDGLDSLLSIVQMPAGISVATVGINNSKNGALMACQIISLNDDLVAAKLDEYRELQKNKVLNSKLE